MKTVVRQFCISTNQNALSEDFKQAWCEVPHTAIVLGLSEGSDCSFQLVCQYAEEEDTPATTKRLWLYLLSDGDSFAKGVRPEYVGTVSRVTGLSGAVHVFKEKTE